MKKVPPPYVEVESIFGRDHRFGHLPPGVETPGYYPPSLQDGKSPMGATDNSPAIYCRVAGTMIKAEDVRIALKVKPSLNRKPIHELLVQCDQLECQYVDRNQFPCPLRLDLFAEEIEKREERRRDRELESS